uniref:Elongation of very long chain fatty acids protein n=1 Tax=Panagrolaimus sp. JU765 TaxID=591449 RepID=A0AC34PW40_9BILA
MFKLYGLWLIFDVFVALCSIAGFLRLTPELFWSIDSNNLKYSFCTASFLQGVSRYWANIFLWLKLMELFAAAFTVINKSPEYFFHWSYHVAIFIYTWHAYMDHTASERWLMWTNFILHAVIYSFYAVRCYGGFKSYKFVDINLKLFQMFIGLFIAITVYFFKSADESCQQTWFSLYLLFVICSVFIMSYFLYHVYLNQVNYSVLEKKEKNLNGNVETIVKPEDGATRLSTFAITVFQKSKKLMHQMARYLFEKFNSFISFLNDDDETLKIRRTRLLLSEFEIKTDLGIQAFDEYFNECQKEKVSTRSHSEFMKKEKKQSKLRHKLLENLKLIDEDLELAKSKLKYKEDTSDPGENGVVKLPTVKI